MAIGNMGGRYLIAGITDKRPRRIVGLTPVPTADDLERIRASVADYATIHVRFELVQREEGTILIVHIPPRPRGLPFHTADGKYLIRMDGQVRGMSVQEMDQIRAEAGTELSARSVFGTLDRLIRPAGVESLRELMREAQSAEDLLAQSDGDLLRSLTL